MQGGCGDSIDVIQELRLRQWARERYVPADQRNRRWHPVVLEEMSFRDAELEAARLEQDLLCTSFVPLEPTAVRYLEDSHIEVPSPKLIRTPVEQRIRLH